MKKRTQLQLLRKVIENDYLNEDVGMFLYTAIYLRNKSINEISKVCKLSYMQIEKRICTWAKTLPKDLELYVMNDLAKKNELPTFILSDLITRTALTKVTFKKIYICGNREYDKAKKLAISLPYYIEFRIKYCDPIRDIAKRHNLDPNFVFLGKIVYDDLFNSCNLVDILYRYNCEIPHIECVIFKWICIHSNEGKIQLLQNLAMQNTLPSFKLAKQIATTSLPLNDFLKSKTQYTKNEQDRAVLLQQLPYYKQFKEKISQISYSNVQIKERLERECPFLSIL